MNKIQMYIFHAGSLMMLLALIFLVLLTNYRHYPTDKLADGMLVGWIMQYMLSSVAIYITKK